MANTAFRLRIVCGVDDPQKLFMTDFAFQCGQFSLQLFAEIFERGQKGLAIGLNLEPDLFPLRRGGRALELSQQRCLLREELVASLVERVNERLYLLGDSGSRRAGRHWGQGHRRGSSCSGGGSRTRLRLSIE